MRFLIAAVFFVATLLSVSSSAFAEELGPGPAVSPSATPSPSPSPSATPSPTLPGLTVPATSPSLTPSPAPSSQSSSINNTPPIRETGRYHPCPSSVGFGNGRSVCLGLDNHVHVASYRCHYGYHYGYAVPVFEKNGNAYYGFPAPSYIHTPWPIYVAVPIPPAPIVSTLPYGYGLGYWGGYGYGWR